MLTLYSYPQLFGVADNNGYGLKVYAFLKLSGVPFVHEHVFDASAAPRGQLPYVVDDGETIGDSETIIAHAIARYHLTIDAALSPAQRRTHHFVTRMLDDLYWVMSYSRWKDERYYPAFRDGFIAQHPQIDVDGFEKAKAYNAQRYHYQGIGRYTPEQAYARGLADLQVLAEILPATGFVDGERPTSCDAGIYGFIANIHYFPIPTPLKAFVEAQKNLVTHCERVHAMVGGK
ncbi:glutathione S-transferase [Bradyrhizobium sp. USDA 4449]